MTDGETKVFACLGEVVHQALELLLNVCYNCSIISKEYVLDEGLAYFGSCSEVGQVEWLTICLSVKVDDLSLCP